MIELAVLRDLVTKGDIREYEPMKLHTTFRVGGPARYYIAPDCIEEVIAVVNACKENRTPYMVIGRGSNLLVSDSGYDGVIISLKNGLNRCEILEDGIVAEAGVMLPQLAVKALDAGFGGLEFAAGIPGTVGGAAAMNAGAYGGEMKQVIKEAAVLTQDGEFLVIQNEDLQLSYRNSRILKEDLIVLSCTFLLSPCERGEVKDRMDDYNQRRKDKQPLEYPSAGSTFKRPEGYFAGRLIEDAGLKGYTVGGAQVSKKHAGFVINKGNASAQDIVSLCADVKRIVYEQFGVTLDMEVKKVGNFL